MRKRLRENNGDNPTNHHLDGDHQRVEHNAWRTAAFRRSMSNLKGYALLREGMAYLARPQITLSDDQLSYIMSCLKMCRKSLKDSPRNNHRKREEYFRRVLQHCVPLAHRAEFKAAQARFSCLDAAIESAVAYVAMPDARRLECQELRCCVWDVAWSDAVDDLLVAFRVTTLGTVRDTFEGYAVTRCIESLKTLLKSNDKVFRLMICGAAGEREFGVTVRQKKTAPRKPYFLTSFDDDDDDEYDVPISTPGRSFPSTTCTDGAGLVFFPPDPDFLINPNLHTVRRPPGFHVNILQLIAGAKGSGKTTAALWLALEYERRGYAQAYNDPCPEGGMLCVFYCKAADFMTVNETIRTGPITATQRRNSRNGVVESSNLPSGCTNLRENTRYLAEYVKENLLGNNTTTTTTGQRKVVYSIGCRVTIVLDDIGAFPQLISDLVADYYILGRELKEALGVGSIKVIAAGHGVEGFYQYVRDVAFADMFIRSVGLDLWEMLAIYLEKENCPYVRLLEAPRRAEHQKWPKSLKDSDPHNFGWLRVALRNARFACIFTSYLNDRFKQHGLMLCDSMNACGLRFTAHLAMHDFLKSCGLPTAPNAAATLLQRAIGAMLNRQPVARDGRIQEGSTGGEWFDIVNVGSMYGWVAPYAKLDVNNEEYSQEHRYNCTPFSVHRVFCSMFMLIIGAVESDVDRCPLAHAVFDFAFLAASVPSAALEGRQRVQPLRRLLNHLGNDASASAGVRAMRLVPPASMPIGTDTDWVLAHPIRAAAKIAAAEKNENVDEKHVRGFWSDADFWAALTDGVRGDGRAAVIANDRVGRREDGSDGAAVIVIAPQSLTLLACPRTAPLAALFAMAPVAAHADCVLDVGKDNETKQRQQKINTPTSSDHSQGLTRQRQQRVPEELAALALGVTFKRCPRTHRAMVRTPPTSSNDDASSAPPVYIINVAVVCQGKNSAELGRYLLPSAYGGEWLGDWRGTSGPLNTNIVNPQHHHLPHNPSPPVAADDRAPVEVVLDYILDEDDRPVRSTNTNTAAVDSPPPPRPSPNGRRKAAKRRRNTPTSVTTTGTDISPPSRNSGRRDVVVSTVRVAYRYFLIDVTESDSLDPVPKF